MSICHGYLSVDYRDPDREYVSIFSKKDLNSVEESGRTLCLIFSVSEERLKLDNMGLKGTIY